MHQRFTPLVFCSELPLLVRMLAKGIVSLSLIVISAVQAIVSAQGIQEDQMRATTPEAPWTIHIDGQKLELRDVKVKPGGKSAYFLMANKETGLNASIFIEPADKCKTSEECRDFVLNTGNPAWGKYQDLAKSNIGDFSYFEFYRPEAMNQPLQMQDMYAQYVGSGYWVDLHISKVQYKKADHVLFENLIKSVRFVPKSDKTAADSDKNTATARKTAENWLAVWDTKKCDESYSSLTSISRSAVTQMQWIDYCEAAHKALGKLKSRELIATKLTKSLPAKPDYSGATLTYQSDFDNGPVIEIISLTIEKDGTWTVSHYRTN